PASITSPPDCVTHPVVGEVVPVHEITSCAAPGISNDYPTPFLQPIHNNHVEVRAVALDRCEERPAARQGIECTTWVGPYVKLATQPLPARMKPIHCRNQALAVGQDHSLRRGDVRLRDADPSPRPQQHRAASVPASIGRDLSND